MPNVRVVAGAFPERDNPDERVSSMVMQFGQFLDHDISSTSFPEKRCCLNPSRPECFNINVPESDPSFPMRKNTSMSCIDFARSRPACGQPGREQVNTITAFIDCSNVYGSEEDLAGDLRARVGGRLVESDQRPGHLPTKEQLKQTSDHLGVVHDSRILHRIRKECLTKNASFWSLIPGIRSHAAQSTAHILIFTQ